MADKSPDLEIHEAITTAQTDLETTMQVVRDLANELATVVDVIEPALEDQTKRLRQARMNSINELRLVTAALREFQQVVLSDANEAAFQRAERFVRLMTEIEEFRACGAMAAFVAAFPEV